MTQLRARVRKGRLILDEPTNLPEGTIVDLVIDDEGDELSAQELQVRDAAITEAWESAKPGKGRTAQEVLDDLQKQQ